MSEINSEIKKIDLKSYFIYSKNDLGEKIGVCKICQDNKIEKSIKMKQGNTTGLKLHINNRHKQEFNILYGSFSEKNKNSEKSQQSLETFLIKQK